MAGTVWEHKVVNVREALEALGEADGDAEVWESDVLNQEAVDGWELVSVSAFPDGYGRIQTYAYFKRAREIPASPQEELNEREAILAYMGAWAKWHHEAGRTGEAHSTRVLTNNIRAGFHLDPIRKPQEDVSETMERAGVFYVPDKSLLTVSRVEEGEAIEAFMEEWARQFEIMGKPQAAEGIRHVAYDIHNGEHLAPVRRLQDLQCKPQGEGPGAAEWERVKPGPVNKDAGVPMQITEDGLAVIIPGDLGVPWETYHLYVNTGPDWEDGKIKEAWLFSAED